MISSQDQNSISEISYPNRVPTPLFYMDHQQVKHKFKHLEAITKTHLSNLLQYVAPEANLNYIPSFKKFHCHEAHLSVLNYTSDQLTFSKNRKLYINKQMIIDFTKDNCRLIAYKIPQCPDITCLEIKDDHKILPSERCFITKISHIFYWTRPSRIYGFAIEFLNYAHSQNLISQIPIQIADSDAFIRTNRCMNSLIKKMAPEASIKKNPSLCIFNPRKDFPRFTILNHTDHSITFDVLRNLYINHEPVVKFTNDNCQMIVYQLEGHPELICFDQQDEADESRGPSFFAKATWMRAKESDFKKTLGKIHTSLAVNYLWKCLYDERSVISKNGVTKDILSKIIAIYLSLTPSQNLIKNDLDRLI